MASCSCRCCSRIFVFIMNILMACVALAVIALALWIRFDDSFESELRENIKRTDDPEPLSGTKNDMRDWIIATISVICGFAGACVITGAAGFLGAAASSTALLVIYFIIQLVIILGEIAIGIVVLVARDNIKDKIYDYVLQSYQASPQDVIAIQYRYDCCGVEGFPNNQCPTGPDGPLKNCSYAVWDRLDFTMMIFGLSMLGVVLLQILTLLVSIIIFARKRPTTTYG